MTRASTDPHAARAIVKLNRAGANMRNAAIRATRIDGANAMEPACVELVTEVLEDARLRAKRLAQTLRP